MVVFFFFPIFDLFFLSCLSHFLLLTRVSFSSSSTAPLLPPILPLVPNQQSHKKTGFVWWAQQQQGAIAYATIAPTSGDLSGTTVAVTGLPALSPFLAFGQGDRVYSASFTGKVTRCVYTFQGLSKALGSTPYPPVVNQCKTVQPSVAGAAVQVILGFAVGPSNY